MSRLSTLTHVNKANSSSAARLRSTATVALTPHHRRPADNMCGAWRRELCGGGHTLTLKPATLQDLLYAFPDSARGPSVAKPAPPLPASPIRTPAASSPHQLGLVAMPGGRSLRPGGADPDHDAALVWQRGLAKASENL